MLCRAAGVPALWPRGLRQMALEACKGDDDQVANEFRGYGTGNFEKCFHNAPVAGALVSGIVAMFPCVFEIPFCVVL